MNTPLATTPPAPLSLDPSLRGSVALIGAGPGDPDLLTLRAWRLLQQAEVILCDHLVSDPIRDCFPRGVRVIDVGKIPGGKATSQEVINALLIKEARSNHFVVRLKGGDPLVFGRGGEEAMALAKHNIRCQVVPGISSALAVPALAGIPVTHRHISTHFTVLTGVSAREEQGELTQAWELAAKQGGTLVFLMGVRALPRIVEALLRGGLDIATPVAIVERGTRATQRTTTGSLQDIVELATRQRVRSPAIIIVGEVVRLREEMNLFLPHLDDVFASAAPDAGAQRATSVAI